MTAFDNKYLSKLTKKEIILLPGFENKQNESLIDLRNQLNERLRKMNLNIRGIKVRDYKRRFKEQDNQLFNQMKNKKTKRNQQKEYRKSIKQKAINERNQIYNIINDVYKESKTELRKEYEKRIKSVNNKKNFQNYMKQFMQNVNKETGFEIIIGDDEDKRLAFCETLRKCYNKKTNKKILVRCYDLNGSSKILALNHHRAIDLTIGHISGSIDVVSDESDSNPYAQNYFVPIKYELMFVSKNKINRKTQFTKRKQNPKTNKIYDEEIEIDEDFRSNPSGGFWAYINLSEIDLSDFQIYKTIDKNNYRDNCFVYSCIKSNVFKPEEINHLRYFIQTREIPNNKIIDISKAFKCHFIIKRIDETRPIARQQKINIDTRKKDWAKSFKRTIELILYKEHYLLNKKINCTTFYLSHLEQINKLFPTMELEQKMRIKEIRNNKPILTNEGTNILTILRKMFQLNLFREINQCEQNILSTTEYHHLNDYNDLNYDPKLCCKPINPKEQKEKDWTEIYYSDFETDTTISPHKPYLNCTVHRNKEKIITKTFIGTNIANELLDYLENGSLTYFHNLKYDCCFFINNDGWNVQITERNGTTLQIIMTKYNGKQIEKRLTFRNSYSIIPSALKNFAEMFHLNVHKEVMAYKIYNERNLNRKKVSALEFQLQYYLENKDKKSLKEIKSDWRQLIDNSISSNSFIKDKLEIDILKYAQFYCKKDCIVLMKGIEKFNNDLINVFKETDTKMLGVHNFISISAIGYRFALNYGCFDGCFELTGKPQNFILRCISGGRTMTANNEKHIVEGRIQDFDAVSLYPSAMSIMNGVPKGKPKIIPKNITTKGLLKYDTFFAEINIKFLKCKSNYEYKFGQVFHFNEAGSKIFCNQPINHFYLDKVAFMDLLEFYEMDYEFIRGYYFNEGFNNKINDFITKLFNLRLKYKKEKNPLEKTIKLLLNSIYGKSILKATECESKCIPKENLYKYIWKNYNFIKEVIEEPSINNVYVKRIKAINEHFNLPQFGASVLSWSKHLMNQVIGTAEQNGINIYYQDCDSLHIMEDDVERLSKIYEQKYNKQLIGTQMTQFHCDFDSFEGSIGTVYSRKLIALGKKSYLDILVDEKGNEGYHIRMKGIPKQVIINKVKRMNITVEELYERMYNGEEIEFNLLDGTNCFKKTKCFQQINLSSFIRRVHF